MVGSFVYKVEIFPICQHNTINFKKCCSMLAVKLDYTDIFLILGLHLHFCNFKVLPRRCYVGRSVLNTKQRDTLRYSHLSA